MRTYAAQFRVETNSCAHILVRHFGEISFVVDSTLGEAKRKATCQDAADVAEALANIRTYFMPTRTKQTF